MKLEDWDQVQNFVCEPRLKPWQEQIQNSKTDLKKKIVIRGHELSWYERSWTNIGSKFGSGSKLWCKVLSEIAINGVGSNPWLDQVWLCYRILDLISNRPVEDLPSPDVHKYIFKQRDPWFYLWTQKVCRRFVISRKQDNEIMITENLTWYIGTIHEPDKTISNHGHSLVPVVIWVY